MEKIREKPGFFVKIKRRWARGLLIACVLYVIFMLILLATNRTNVSADVLVLWMLAPVIWLSLVAAIMIEISWSIAMHYTRRALLEEQNPNVKEENLDDKSAG